MYKYKSKFIVSLLFLFTITSCMQKHKFAKDNKQLSDKKMQQVLTDVFLMESYVNEKYKPSNADSAIVIKKSFYPIILKHHKVDSVDFYETLDYYQAHPGKFVDLLTKIDSVLNKITPLDTTKIVSDEMDTPPAGVEKLLNYRGRADMIEKAFENDSQLLRKIKYRREANSK